MTKEQRKQLNIEQGGVFIVNVEQDGAAAAAGIRKGDVIISIDNQKISDVKQFVDQVKKIG